MKFFNYFANEGGGAAACRVSSDNFPFAQFWTPPSQQ